MPASNQRHEAGGLTAEQERALAALTRQIEAARIRTAEIVPAARPAPSMRQRRQRDWLGRVERDHPFDPGFTPHHRPDAQGRIWAALRAGPEPLWQAALIGLEIIAIGALITMIVAVLS